MSMAESPPPLDLRDLKAVSVLGHGAKGVVFLVRLASPAGGEILALKALSRSSIERKAAVAGAVRCHDAYRRVWLERDVLFALRHPLLPSLRGVVSTDKIVGFAIDCCSGGSLASLRRRQTEKMFSNDVIRFYAAELILALEHLHRMGIVYRDLKPENVLIQQSGHLMLVDFDLSTKLYSGPSMEIPPSVEPRLGEHRDPTPPAARISNKGKTTIRRTTATRLPRCFTCNAGTSPETADTSPETAESSPSSSHLKTNSSPPSTSSSSVGKSKSFVGTEDYVAPEIIRGSGHDFAVDWWGLGVLLYEMLYGRTPFRGGTRKETFSRILTEEPELEGEETALHDLIRRLLEKDPKRRISCGGVKAHVFFRGVVWEAVTQLLRPPFIPPAEEEAECWWEGEGMQGIDVERTVEEVAAAAKQQETAGIDGKRVEGANVNKSPPMSADFSLF